VTQKVLIAGATGMLGSRIAYYLLEQPETELRLLVRPGSLSDARKAGRISSLIERSAVVAHGDLTRTGRSPRLSHAPTR
jgi:nucleoside-diphosphate-sugar epimerase